MTTPTHDPLTDRHKAILARAPFEMSSSEREASPDRDAILFLARIGYLRLTHTHVAEAAGDNRWKYEKTDKPID